MSHLFFPVDISVEQYFHGCLESKHQFIFSVVMVIFCLREKFSSKKVAYAIDLSYAATTLSIREGQPAT